MKAKIVWPIILVTFFLFVGCSKKAVETPAWKPLNDLQIKQFTYQNKIEPLAVKGLSKSTVILSENNNGFWHCNLSVDENGKFQVWEQGTGNDDSPVMIEGYGTIDVNSPVGSYITVLIKDKKILQDAYRMQGKFDNNVTFTEIIQNKKAIIIPAESGSSNLAELTIFDKKDGILFKM